MSEQRVRCQKDRCSSRIREAVEDVVEAVEVDLAKDGVDKV